MADTRLLDRVESLTVQQILTFCHVYEQGGYAAASEETGLASPTLWEHVKALEKIYRTELFSRNGRSIVPTASGRELYDLLRPLLASLQSTLEHISEANETVRQLSLVTGVRMMLEELGKPMRLFRERFPQTRLKLMTADNLSAQQWVLEGRADMALLIEPPQDIIAQGITCERLYPIEYLLALPARHRLSSKKRISLQELVGEPLVLGNPNTIGRKMLEHAFFRLGITTPLQIAAETDNSATILACVRAGLGLGVIASLPGGNLTKHCTTRSLSEQIGHVHVVAAYRKGRQLPNAHRQMLDLIRQQTAATTKPSGN